jgi:hypothetical protein
VLRDEVLPDAIKAAGFRIPAAYYEMREMGITRLDPWFFLDLSGVSHNYDNLRKRYPTRLLVPFARSGVDDYVACFVATSDNSGQGQVLVLKDTRPAGAEVEAVFEDFLDWLRAALGEMLEFLRLGQPPDTWAVA